MDYAEALNAAHEKLSDLGYVGQFWPRHTSLLDFSPEKRPSPPSNGFEKLREKYKKTGYLDWTRELIGHRNFRVLEFMQLYTNMPKNPEESTDTGNNVIHLTDEVRRNFINRNNKAREACFLFQKRGANGEWQNWLWQSTSDLLDPENVKNLEGQAPTSLINFAKKAKDMGFSSIEMCMSADHQVFCNRLTYTKSHRIRLAYSGTEEDPLVMVEKKAIIGNDWEIAHRTTVSRFLSPEYVPGIDFATLPDTPVTTIGYSSTRRSLLSWLGFES